MENKSYSYKKLSHFRDMLKINNETNKIHPYTDKQFEEDFKKMLIETKTIKPDKVDKLLSVLNEKRRKGI